MKICWNNLEKYDICLSKKGNFNDINGQIYYYVEKCNQCGESFLGRRKDTKFCNRKCSSDFKKGKNHWNWKGGIKKKFTLL